MLDSIFLYTLHCNLANLQQYRAIILAKDAIQFHSSHKTNPAIYHSPEYFSPTKALKILLTFIGLSNTTFYQSVSFESESFSPQFSHTLPCSESTRHTMS